MASLVASTGLLLWIWRVYQGHVSPWLIVDDACGRGSKLRQFPQVDSFSSFCLYLCKHHEIDFFFFARHQNQERFRNRYYFSNRSQYVFFYGKVCGIQYHESAASHFLYSLVDVLLAFGLLQASEAWDNRWRSRCSKWDFLSSTSWVAQWWKEKFLKLWSLILLMLQKSGEKTSWYGKYPIIFEGF